MRVEAVAPMIHGADRGHALGVGDPVLRGTGAAGGERRQGQCCAGAQKRAAVRYGPQQAGNHAVVPCFL